MKQLRWDELQAGKSYLGVCAALPGEQIVCRTVGGVGPELGVFIDGETDANKRKMASDFMSWVFVQIKP